MGDSELHIPNYKKVEPIDEEIPMDGKKEDSIMEPQSSSQRTQVNSKENQTGNVKVYCRFRPLNQRELTTTGNKTCCQFPDSKTVTLMGINGKTGQSEPIPFNYD